VHQTTADKSFLGLYYFYLILSTFQLRKEKGI